MPAAPELLQCAGEVGRVEVHGQREAEQQRRHQQHQQRVLDRLVGFELSPILWKKIQPKLSAGRVQSVALRLIVDREKEIMAFTPEPFYRVEATFQPEGTAVKVKATLDTRFSTEDQARAFLQDSIGAIYSIAAVDKTDGTRYPAPPFTTSTLQQEASRRLSMALIRASSSPASKGFGR